MRTYSAAVASRRFSELLDAVEGGRSGTITHGGQPVVVIHPIRRRTVGALTAHVGGMSSLDDDVENDINSALTWSATARRLGLVPFLASVPLTRGPEGADDAAA